MNKDEITVVLGALLHDLGKLAERAGESLPEWAAELAGQSRFGHEAFSAVFAETLLGGNAAAWQTDKEALMRVVVKHHQASQTDERLVRLADRLSAYEHAEESGDAAAARGLVEVRLQRALAGLKDGLKDESKDGAGDADVERFCHPIEPLSVSEAFLFDENGAAGSAEAYGRLWLALTVELAAIAPGDVNGLLAALKRYVWAVPSNAEVGLAADVSLFEHLKSSAAIAVCLHRAAFGEDGITALDEALTRRIGGERLADEVDKPLGKSFCALVKGDISGTQEFLYLLTSDGAARGLRGRSFYLQLLTETIARWVLREFKLPETNLLFAGGGDFYLLLPLGELRGKLDELRKQIAEKLWLAHEGDLALTIEFAELAALDFLGGGADGGFAAKWAEVSHRAYERKQRRWSELGGTEMFDKLFTSCQQGTTAEQMCQVCHGEWIKGIDSLRDDVRRCRRCARFEELGQKLRDATHLIVFDVPVGNVSDNTDWHNILRGFGAEARVIDPNDGLPIPPPDAKRATVSKIFSSDKVVTHWTQKERELFSWGNPPATFDHRLLADVTPRKRDEKDPNAVADFSDLAEASDGVKWLGVLRMDVDSLGDVFKKRLGKRATLARLSTLSESLRMFFEGWIPQRCREYNQFNPDGGGEDRLYLIYAGGDDLFVVGAWSALPELAKQIRDDFRRFAGGDHITLSGGISIEHQKYPLYQFARDARHALDDQAKEFIRDKSHPKDAVCFMQKPMGWEEFDEIASWHDRLLEMLRGEQKLPRGFLTRMSEIHALYEENAKRQRRRERQEQISLEQMREEIHYAKWMWRLVHHLGRYRQRYQDHQTQIEELEQAITRNDNHLIEQLHVLARWTALLTREG
jgi:CRISPR-associated protein Csm1